VLKHIWCWLVGCPCRFETCATQDSWRDASGIYYGTAPPHVKVTQAVQLCKVCGRRRSAETVCG